MLLLAERDYQALRTQSGAAPHHLPEWKKVVVSIAIQPASPYAFHQWTRVAVKVDPRCRGPLWSHPKTPANTDLGDRGGGCRSGPDPSPWGGLAGLRATAMPAQPARATRPPGSRGSRRWGGSPSTRSRHTAAPDEPHAPEHPQAGGAVTRVSASISHAYCSPREPRPTEIGMQ